MKKILKTKKLIEVLQRFEVLNMKKNLDINFKKLDSVSFLTLLLEVEKIFQISDLDIEKVFEIKKNDSWASWLCHCDWRFFRGGNC